MWTGGCHYEIVGRLLPGNRIQREFDFKDSLIKRIYTYLCKPEKIADAYPNLIPYLPKDLRKKLKIDVSDSEEDRRSDRSHRSNDEGKYLNSDEYECSSAYERSGSEEDEPVRDSKRNAISKKEDDRKSKKEDGTEYSDGDLSHGSLE
jgi:hypothetical protein